MTAWVDEFVRSPGFGGLAAVVAASIAYLGVRRNIKAQEKSTRLTIEAQEKQAAEDRWWDQAKWASEQLSRGDDAGIDIGLAALHHLAEAAAGSQAGEFVQAAVLPIIYAPLEDSLDLSSEPGAHLGIDEQEASDVNQIAEDDA